MLSCSTYLFHLIMKVIILPNGFFNDVNDGHYSDGDVVMLASIVVMVVTGGSGCPGCQAYPSLPSVRT